VAFALGTSIAYFDSGAIDWQSVFLGQLVVTSIQLMTHYSNDYFDFDGDRANSSLTRWSGGSGILSEGLLPRWVALCSAVAWATIAAVVIHLTYRRNPEGIVLASMLGMLVLAWFYSAPPLRLHTRGLGELTASIIVAGAVPALGYALQTGSLSSALLLGLLPFFLAQCAMLLIVSAPDITADRASGKRTLLLRIGPGRAGFALCALLVLMYAILPLLTAAGLPKSVVLATSCTAPLAGLIFWWVRGGALDQPKMWPRLTESAVALVFLCALAATLGFALR
jgi:1,4-dihydroxy-2-naphthoate octaprenyltransferase